MKNLILFLSLMFIISSCSETSMKQYAEVDVSETELVTSEEGITLRGKMWDSYSNQQRRPDCEHIAWCCQRAYCEWKSCSIDAVLTWAANTGNENDAGAIFGWSLHPTMTFDEIQNLSDQTFQVQYLGDDFIQILNNCNLEWQDATENCDCECTGNPPNEVDGWGC